MSTPLTLDESPATASQAWLGQFAVCMVRGTGADVRDLLQRLGTQDLRALAASAGAPTQLEGLFVTHQGKLVAHVRFVADADGLWLLGPAGAGAGLCEWLTRYTVAEEAHFEVVDEQRCVLRLLATAPGRRAAWPTPQGQTPLAAHAQPAQDHSFDSARDALVADAALCLPAPAAWGVGCDLVLHAASTAAGPSQSAAHAVHQASADELNFFRLWVGEPGYGADYAVGAAPLEWRLGQRTIDWHKGCFVGQEVLSRLDNYKKVARFAMGIRCETGAHELASAASIRVLRDGRPIGTVTSHSAAAPAATVLAGVPPQAAIGLALVKKDDATEGPVHLAVTDASSTTPHIVPAMLEHRPYWQ